MRVPEYQSNVQLRPAFQSNIDVRATPEAFGAGIGRGMQDVAQGLGQAGDAMAQAQQLTDETVARDARNKFMADADEATYGDNGYAQQTGKAAIDGFSDYGRRLEQIRSDHSAKLTPAQQAIFGRAVDVDELQRKRTAINHRGNETRKFVVETHEAGATSFLNEAVRSRGDAKQSAHYLAAARAEVDNLGKLQGLPPAALTLKQEAVSDDYYSRVSFDMANDDPIAAVEYAQKNLGNMSPDAANKLLATLAKPFATAAGRDAITSRASRVSPDIAVRQKQAMAYFMREGLTKEQSGAIVGNLMAESNLNPAVKPGDKGTAHGIAQWRHKRFINLKRHAASQGKDWQDFETQLGFVLVELKGDEASAYRELLSAKTVDEATAAFVGFERPQGWTAANPRGGHNYKGRLSHAMRAAGMDVAAGDALPAGDGGIVFSERTEKVIAGLPHYMGDQVRQIAAGDIKDYEAATAASFKTEQAEAVNRYKLRIETADQSLTVPEILADPILDDGDRATLIGRHDEKFKGLREAQANVALFNGGSFHVDPYSTEGRKAVDGVWDRFAVAAADAGDPRRAISILPNLVEQTGVIPEKVFNGLRGAVSGNSVPTLVEGLNLAATLSEADATAFGKRDGGAGISDALSSYRHYTDLLGMTPEQAAQRMIDARDPEKVRQRAALMESKPIVDFIKGQAVEGNVRDIFDPGILGSDPKLGETPAQSAAMTAEYRSMLEESLFDAAGDQALGKTLAADRFRRRYGTSDFAISGPKVISRLPPEVTYPAGKDGTWGYIGEQVKSALAEAGVTADAVYLQADATTDRDFKAGKPARYRVFYENQDGVMEQYRLPFYAVPPSSNEISAARKAQSEARRNENRDLLDASRDREGTLDRFLDGSPLTGGF